jgi:PAS domain S-box-containing protein
VVIADDRGNLLDWNPAARRLHGFDNEEDVCLPLAHFFNHFELAPPGGGAPLPLEQWPLARALRGETVSNHVLAVTRTDVGWHWVISYSAARIPSDDPSGAGGELIVMTLRDLTARHLAEAASGRARAQLRELIESLPQLIWTCRPDGACDYLSPQWVIYTGTSPLQHLGYGWLQAVHPADRERAKAMWSETAAQGRAFEAEFRIRRADGEYRWFSTRAKPIRGDDGRIIRWIGSNTDVHDERMAAEALRQSETRFRRLADAMPQIVRSLTPDGRVNYLNEGWHKYTGLAEAAPDTLTRIVHPDDVDTVRRTREEAIRAGRPYSVEFRMRSATGGPYRWFLARAVPATDDDGTLIEWFGTSTDIEEVKQAEASARENEARLRGVFESAVEGIVTIDQRGTIQTVNPAVEKTFGYTREEMIGQNVKILMPEPFASAHDEYLQSYLTTGRRKIIGIGREVVGRRKDGSTFPVDLSVSEVRVGDRRIFTGMIRDITQRKAMEDEARERQAQVAHLERVSTMGQMASGLAHELNQPLGAIANYAKACRSMVESGAGGGGQAPPARVADMLSEIQSQAMRAGEIIQRLRAFVKKRHPKPRPTDANELVQETLRLLAFELRTSGVRLALRFAADLPQVLADQVQIGQVLVNLIRNALDALQERDGCDNHGSNKNNNDVRRLTLTTSCSADSSAVTVAVADNGCGVLPEHMPRLFDAFFTTKSNGLGVGLALCRTIVEDHGGQLTAEQNPAGGMTFTLKLRVAPAPVEPPAGERPAVDSSSRARADTR